MSLCGHPEPVGGYVAPTPMASPQPLATATAPPSSVRVGPAQPGTDWLMASATVWPQTTVSEGPYLDIVGPLPVDAAGRPVFPDAPITEVHDVAVAGGATVFVYITIATYHQVGAAPSVRTPECGEYEVAHVRLYDRTGSYTYDYRDLTFTSGAGNSYNPLPAPDAELAFGPPLGSGTLNQGQSAEGFVAFDVPAGGGEVTYFNVVSPAFYSLPSAPALTGAYSYAAVGAYSIGMWHTST
jgi:hypothetical protein